MTLNSNNFEFHVISQRDFGGVTGLEGYNSVAEIQKELFSEE